MSSSAIATARDLRRNLNEDVPIQFEHKRIEDLPPRTFDVVSLIDVMHHVPPPEQERTIKELLGRVAPGGLFLYKDISTKPLWRATANRLHDLVMAREWIHYFPISAVRRIGDEHGMLVLEEAYIPRLWYGHDLLVLRKPETTDSRSE